MHALAAAFPSFFFPPFFLKDELRCRRGSPLRCEVPPPPLFPPFFPARGPQRDHPEDRWLEKQKAGRCHDSPVGLSLPPTLQERPEGSSLCRQHLSSLFLSSFLARTAGNIEETEKRGGSRAGNKIRCVVERDAEHLLFPSIKSKASAPKDELFFFFLVCVEWGKEKGNEGSIDLFFFLLVGFWEAVFFFFFFWKNRRMGGG